MEIATNYQNLRFFKGALAGVIATLAMDCLSTLAHRLGLAAPLAVNLIGRWFASILRLQPFHQNIANSPAARNAAIRQGSCALALVFAALGVPAHAETRNATVIRHVRVFDGQSVINGTSVLIANGKVTAIGPSLTVPMGTTVVEGNGRTLLPGLIDAHTHIRSRQDLEQSRALGVTTDVCMLMDVKLFRAIKQEQQANGANNRADLFSSGYAATAPGGHRTEKGLSVPTISDPEEAQTWVDNRIAEGSEFIKIIYENGGDLGQGGRPSIDKATLRALIVAAHGRGKLAVVHIHSEAQAVDAIEANADGLAHLFSHGSDILDPQFAQIVAAHHAFVIPTLSVLESVCNQNPGRRVLNDPKLGPYIFPAYHKQLQGNINHGREGKCMIASDAILPLAAAGVPVLAGTDAGNLGTAPGSSLHGELEYLVEAGLTPLQALVTATSASATAFHLSDRGRIAPGLRADLVLFKGNPTEDIRATRDVEGIWKAGIPFCRPQWLNRSQQNGATSSEIVQHRGTGKAETRSVLPRSC
jgi:imidazolonepropionase-like amidohydrolase